MWREIWNRPTDIWQVELLVPRGGIDPSPIRLKIHHFSNGNLPVYLPVDPALSGPPLAKGRWDTCDLGTVSKIAQLGRTDMIVCNGSYSPFGTRNGLSVHPAE